MKMDEVLALLEETSPVLLATVAGDRPSARTMTLKKLGGGLYMLTEAGSPKIVQIRQNPRCLVYRQLSDGKYNGFISLDCLAGEVNDPDLKRQVYASASYASTYWSSPDDPKLCLLRLTPTGGRILPPGEECTSGIE